MTRHPSLPRRGRLPEGLVLDRRGGSVAVKPLDREALIERVAEALACPYAHGIITARRDMPPQAVRPRGLGPAIVWLNPSS
jgi:hypothetical protein